MRPTLEDLWLPISQNKTNYEKKQNPHCFTVLDVTQYKTKSAISFTVLDVTHYTKTNRYIFTVFDVTNYEKEAHIRGFMAAKISKQNRL